MTTVLRILGLILLGLSIVGLVAGVRILRRELPVRTTFDVARVAISLGAAALIGLALRVGTPPWLIATAAATGLAVGIVQGRAMRVRIEGDMVYAQRTAAGIAAWGLGMIVAQAAGLGSRAGLVQVGLAVAYFSAAMIAGTILGRTRAIARARGG